MAKQSFLVIYPLVNQNHHMATKSDAALRDTENRRVRLRQWIDEHHGGVQAEFVQAHGLNQGEVSALLRTKSFGSSKARNLESKVGMPEHYLEQRPAEAGPTAQDAIDPPETRFDVNVKTAYVGLRAFPVISKIQAGRVKEIACPYEPGDGYAIEYGDDDASPWAFFLEVDGESMLPEFRPGDRVQIDPEVSPRPGDFVAARNTDQEATFKKYRVRGIDELGHEIFELVPLNEDYPTVRSDQVHLTIIGTMLEHRKKYRTRQRG